MVDVKHSRNDCDARSDRSSVGGVDATERERGAGKGGGEAFESHDAEQWPRVVRFRARTEHGTDEREVGGLCVIPLCVNGARDPPVRQVTAQLARRERVSGAVEMSAEGQRDVEARVHEEWSAGRVAEPLHTHSLVVELPIGRSGMTMLHGDSRSCPECELEPSQQLVIAKRPVCDDQHAERERRDRHCTRPVSGLDADA